MAINQDVVVNLAVSFGLTIFWFWLFVCSCYDDFRTAAALAVIIMMLVSFGRQVTNHADVWPWCTDMEPCKFNGEALLLSMSGVFTAALFLWMVHRYHRWKRSALSEDGADEEDTVASGSSCTATNLDDDHAEANDGVLSDVHEESNRSKDSNNALEAFEAPSPSTDNA